MPRTAHMAGDRCVRNTGGTARTIAPLGGGFLLLERYEATSTAAVEEGTDCGSHSHRAGQHAAEAGPRVALAREPLCI